MAENYPDTDAIFYSLFEDDRWSEPVDILAASSYASADALVLTPDNHLVVSWTFREPAEEGLRVSRARIDHAGSARDWETTQISAAPVMDSSLFVDNYGRIHLGFIVHDSLARTGFLGYTWSQDNGETWAAPVSLALYDPASTAARYVSIYSDGAELVQMAWAVSTRADDWSPINIMRAVSTDGGATWIDLTEVFPGPRANMPSYLQGAGPGRVYLTWVRGVGFGDSKYAMLSTDSGATWSTPKLIISEKRGMNGPMRMAVDSQGSEYLVLSGDQMGIGTRIWVSQKAGEDSWSDPVPISGTALHECEFPQVAIRDGNELHVFWLDWGQNEVFWVVCGLDVPAARPPVSGSTPTPSPGFTPSAAAVDDPSIFPSAQATVAPTRSERSGYPAEITGLRTGGSAILPAILSTLLLIGLVLGGRLVGRRRCRP